MTRVLVVEDNEQNIYLLDIVLKGHGYETAIAHNGAEALEIAGKDKPDVVISDILMPVMDGFELCRRWKADEHLKSIPFIFYTATYTDSKDEEFALSLGAERFVRKPTAPDQFIEILRDILKAHDQGKLEISQRTGINDLSYFKERSQILERKLEEKTQELSQVTKSLSSLFQISISLSSFQQLDELISDIFHEALPPMNCTIGNYFKFDPENKTFHLFVTTGRSPEKEKTARRKLVFKLGEERGLVGVVGKNQQPMVINDTLNDPRWVLTDKNIRSILLLPVAFEKRLEGVICFLSPKVNNFSENVSREILTVVNNLAIVIEKARLFEKTRQSEISLRESENFLNSIVDNIPNMVFVKDAEHLQFVRINKSGEKLLGMSRDEMYGKSDKDFFPLEEAKHFIQNDREALKSKEIIDIPEEIIQTKNLGVRFLHTQKIAISDEGGNPKYLLGISEDITEQKQKLEALRASTERFAMAFEFAPNGISIVTLEGKYLQVNRTFCDYIGYTEQELLEKTFQEITYVDDLDTDLENVRRLLSNEITSYEMEKRYIHKRGHLIWALLRVSLLHDEKGKPKYFLSQMQDITERKHAEQLLNALNQAAQAMQLALTQQEIFTAVSTELKKHDITCMLFVLNENRDQLMTKYLGFNKEGIRRIEELAEIKSDTFSFSISTLDAFRQVVKNEKTIFLEDAGNIIPTLFPKMLEKLPKEMVKAMFASASVITPLVLEKKLFGVFSLHSNNFNKEDIPIVTAFGNQLAAAWNKADLTAKLQQTLNGIVQTIASTVEIRDPYTSGHQKRVSDLATAIAMEMKMPQNQIEGIRIAGIIHDLGKISVPAEILSKPGKLSEIEFNLIKTHPKNGFELIKNIDFPWPLAQTIHQHHEKMDGSGYPQGLKGEQISIEARVMTVADVVEAMASHRPYRAALGIEKALQEVVDKKGVWFDPMVVDACIKVIEKGFKFE